MVGEEVTLLHGFHAFGDHRQAQALAQGENDAGDGGIAVGVEYILDEGAVDLELIQRQSSLFFSPALM